MKKITAILTQRTADYHVSVKGNTGIWDCGKTLKEAIKQFKLTAKSFGFEMECLEVDISSIVDGSF